MFSLSGVYTTKPQAYRTSAETSSIIFVWLNDNSIANNARKTKNHGKIVMKSEIGLSLNGLYYTLWHMPFNYYCY